MVVLNNGCHGMVRQFQESYFESRYQSTYWGYSAPDFGRIASAYGIRSTTISDPAEVECGLPGPLTLGRVAACVCLVCATSPAERVPFIRADFMDDARYSAWLVGRDQDRAVLYEVFRVMERTMVAPVRRAA